MTTSLSSSPSAHDWWTPKAPLLLASKSATRADMLRHAGLPVEIKPANVDERAVEETLEAEKASPRDTALALARVKAQAIGDKFRDRIVIGADQTLACGPERFNKPLSREAARMQLERLSGRSHTLHSAAVIMHEGDVKAEIVASANLKMRTLSPAFLDRYCAFMGDALLTSVGAYQLEGCGAQLFESVEGDHFTILGLPLLPLLENLRRLGWLMA